jgi:hypothetical protein
MNELVFIGQDPDKETIIFNLEKCLLIAMEQFMFEAETKLKTGFHINANASTPSQAHLQGTQSQHTKTNLANEPALFRRFLGNTLS